MNNILAVNWGTVGIVAAIVAVISVLFGALIVLVSKLCFVKEDEKVKSISEKLAGANCGGCGYAGCADFAKALAEGKADISACGATAKENKADIAAILGIPYSSEEEKIAVVHCGGGDACKDKFLYVGNTDCAVQKSFQGGKKACSFGCLGGGTCKDKCGYGAIEIKNNLAKTNNALCEACGACVKACPKSIIGFIPKSAKVYIACSSLCRGKEVMDACKNGCIGCGLCAKNCPALAIEMVNNLPVIDYAKCTGCKTCVGKCPRKCIKEI